MTWFAVFETVTGRLHSVGEVLADPLPAGLEDTVIASQPDATQMWDENTRLFVARPAKIKVDRLQDILNHPDFAKFQEVWSRILIPGDKTKLMDVLTQLLGGERYRNASEAIQIKPNG